MVGLLVRMGASWANGKLCQLAESARGGSQSIGLLTPEVRKPADLAVAGFLGLVALQGCGAKAALSSRQQTSFRPQSLAASGLVIGPPSVAPLLR